MMLRRAIFLLTLLLLAPSARAEGVYATIETESWTETWIESVGFLYYPESTPFTVRLIASENVDPLEGFVFDFFGSGHVTLESLSLYGGAQNEGDFVDTENGWLQEVRVTDLGECLDPTGDVVLAEFQLRVTGPNSIGLFFVGHSAELPHAFDCTGEPSIFTQFPVHACINCPDPVEQPTIGELKALYDR